MMDLKLNGKAAIVTGAGRGLGLASTIALAEQGTRVLAVSRSIASLEALPLTEEGFVRPLVCDMLDTLAVSGLPEQAVDAFGRLDIVVNNAGVAPAGAFVEQEPSQWDTTQAVNVTAPSLLSRAAGRVFTAQRSGKIINVASTSGILGKAQLVGYSASKGALVQMTKALASEWARFGIQVNAIAPGAFETDAQQAVLEDFEILKRRIRKIPAKRMGQPAEIGPLVCYLASPLSDFVTGAVYVIDGGESCCL